jgi:asparagine synthase (glutamine-hydrolysing)
MMNIIFGVWRPQGPEVTTEELESMGVHTRRFASDGEWYQTTSEIGLGVQEQYTHGRSRLGTQPESDAMGNILAFDGRLDNYRELIRDLKLTGEDTPDSVLILCAYRKWGSGCFVRFVGDWAVVLWDPQSRSLYLARDHAGTRTLHYVHDSVGTVKWATYLDSYIGTDLLDAVDPVYIASYLAMLPCYERTPYQAIQAVLPGYFIKVTPQGKTATQFWDPNLQERIPHGSRSDLKAEFLHLLGQSVARRAGPGAPVLAHLSGGMDSTAIVCIADRLRQFAGDEMEPLNTLSFFDDAEPTWNERPFFTLVEENRGRRGFHLDMSMYRTSFERPEGIGAQYLYPGIERSQIERDRGIYSLTSAGGYRGIISGIGGDEFTGGIPNPAGEVADLVLAGRLLAGARNAIGWCLASRISIVDLLTQSVSFLRSHTDSTQIEAATSGAPWLTAKARQHAQTAIRELPVVRFKPFIVRPATAEQCGTWWSTLRHQPHLKPSEVYRYEYRYPYLDRDFLEFLLRLPAQELAQPGRRRSLMRSALKGIVPEEILERRRKAFLLAGPLKRVRELAPRLAQEIRVSLLVESGYVDRSAIERALAEIVSGETIRWWTLILRFAWLETWLQYRSQSKSVSEPIQNPVGAKMATDQVPAL